VLLRHGETSTNGHAVREYFNYYCNYPVLNRVLLTGRVVSLPTNLQMAIAAVGVNLLCIVFKLSEDFDLGQLCLHWPPLYQTDCRKSDEFDRY
jgi:hypothetical protein